MTQTNQPDFIYPADLNRDHKIDLVTYSEEINAGPAVFLGNGDGTVKLLGNAPLIYATPYITVGDVDGDGIPDIVTAQNEGSITILHRNGDGTFVQTYLYQPPDASQFIPGGLIVVDVNHDGVADIVFTNAFAGTRGYLYILFGTGEGGFRGPSIYQMPPYPGPIAAGDFDGDGNIDLAIANAGENGSVTLPDYSVILLLGAGDGTFITGATIQMEGLYPAWLTVADFDGDGASDLAVQGLSGPPPVMIWGSKARTFAASAISGSLTGDCLVAADFDGDGFPDLANTCNAADILLNRGGRVFEKVYNLGAGLDL